MLELCISGQAFRIFLRSSLAHTMKAFIGRFTWGFVGSGFSLCALIILAPNILPENNQQGSKFSHFKIYFYRKCIKIAVDSKIFNTSLMNESNDVSLIFKENLNDIWKSF